MAGDFAERLSLQFQGQSQHEYFGGGTTVSIESVAVQYLKLVILRAIGAPGHG